MAPNELAAASRLARPTHDATRIRARVRTLTLAVTALGTIGLAACSDDLAAAPAGSEAAPATPAATAADVCDLLRGYVNDTADIANDSALEVRDDGDPVARRDAVLAGFDRLLERTAAHAGAVAGLAGATLAADHPLLADLELGAEQARAELEDERAEFATLDGVEDGDMTGRIGQFFNALEKAMSVVEPDITLAGADLAAAFAAEPDCRFVVQV